jgi:amino acid transporter
MGISVSLILIAAGAILIWAVDATAGGVDLNTIGWILLAIGGIGALLSLVFWSTLGFGARDTVTHERRVVER